MQLLDLDLASLFSVALSFEITASLGALSCGMFFTHKRGVAYLLVPSISTLTVLVSRSFIASWSCLDLVLVFSLRQGSTSICHSLSMFLKRSFSEDETEVKKQCCSFMSHWRGGTGPCNVQPRRVLMAAGPPGGPRRTGSTGVMRWG